MIIRLSDVNMFSKVSHYFGEYNITKAKMTTMQVVTNWNDVLKITTRSGCVLKLLLISDLCE